MSTQWSEHCTSLLAVTLGLKEFFIDLGGGEGGREGEKESYTLSLQPYSYLKGIVSVLTYPEFLSLCLLKLKLVN